MYPVFNAEVINANTKVLATTDTQGKFSIAAKTGDVLVFISKEHYLKKSSVNPNLFTNGEWVVELILKAEELKEVLITNMPSIKLSTNTTYEQTKIDQYALEKRATTPKVLGVYTGELENSPNLQRIAGMLVGLFTKEKEPIKKEAPPILFKDLAKSSCKESYFLEELQLKPDQIDLFLEFCDADPKSKTATGNTLHIMDFLFSKNIEFKKLAPSH